ncbi:hydrogenase maturation nickel metallochaperone HypA [Chloroflexota bacterium]
MHEMAITQGILDLVLGEAARAGAGKVTMINLVLGEMSGIVDEYVQFNFDFMSKHTPAEGAALSFRKVPKQARCRKCAHLFSPGDVFWACPECQSMELEMVSGDELYVESIEVE